MTKKEKFYIDLKERLEEGTDFPTDYLYKFIVPTTKDQVKEIETIFAEKKTKTTKRASKTGKYSSVSILLKVNSADEVIENYLAVEKIEGLISL